MADKTDLLADGAGAALSQLVSALADELQGRRSAKDEAAEEYEKQRVAAVKALDARCKAEEKKIRESEHATQFPQIAAVALRFGWTFEEFLQNVASRGQPRTIAA